MNGNRWVLWEDIHKLWWGFVFWFGDLTPYFKRMASSKNKMNVLITRFWMLKKNKCWGKKLKKKNQDFLFLFLLPAPRLTILKYSCWQKNQEADDSNEFFMWPRQDSIPGSPNASSYHIFTAESLFASQLFSKLQSGCSNCYSV